MLSTQSWSPAPSCGSLRFKPAVTAKPNSSPALPVFSVRTEVARELLGRLSAQERGTPSLVDLDVADDAREAVAAVAVRRGEAQRELPIARAQVEHDVRAWRYGASSRPMVAETPLPNCAVYWMPLRVERQSSAPRKRPAAGAGQTGPRRGHRRRQLTEGEARELDEARG